MSNYQKGIRKEQYLGDWVKWQWYMDDVCHRYYGPQDSRGNWYIHGKRITSTFSILIPKKIR